MSDSIEKFVINENSTLKDALIQMTSTHRGILLVVDNHYTLGGVIADGDVRRSLLDDVSLSIPVTQIMNLNPVVAKSENDAKNILKENPFYILVPVINESGRLTGVLSALDGNGFHKAGSDHDSSQSSDKIIKEKVKFMALIPARGGSKRIPGKNLSKIGNETLLSLAIKSASESSHIDFINVSTDSQKIAKEAESKGVPVKSLRPASLSGDSAATLDVMIHEVKQFESDHEYLPECIVLLEPTAPFRTSSLIDSAIEKFIKSDADSLVSVNKIRHIYHPEELLKTNESGFLVPYLDDRTFDSRKLRDEQDDLFIQNGLVYITRTSVLLDKRSIYGSKVLKFETPGKLFADIDEPEDLELARLKFKNKSTSSII